MSRATARGSVQASACTVTLCAPISAYPGAQRSGFSIIRWQSSGTGLTAWIAWTTGSPRVRFGTKCASMTSTCSQSASATRCVSSARWAKSADRRLGAIIGSRDTSAESRWAAIPLPRTEGSGAGRCRFGALAAAVPPAPWRAPWSTLRVDAATGRDPGGVGLAGTPQESHEHGVRAVPVGPELPVVVTLDAWDLREQRRDRQHLDVLP